MLRRRTKVINSSFSSSSSTVFHPLSLLAPTFSPSFRFITGGGGGGDNNNNRNNRNNNNIQHNINFADKNSAGESTSNVLRGTAATSTRQRAVPYHHQQKALYQHLEHQFEDSNTNTNTTTNNES